MKLLAFTQYIAQDWKANKGDPKMQVTMAFFRASQKSAGWKRRPYPLEAIYRMLTEAMYGMELRPKTLIGQSLVIHHGFGLVVNDNTVIGDRVTLRNGVVIGHKEAHGRCPTIEHDVEVGANAVIIGGVKIGHHAKIGAGAVVVSDVPPYSVAVGNPAMIVGKPTSHSNHSATIPN
jgi:putative colanic acid biosynthesis acetyltransferase WcaB